MRRGRKLIVWGALFTALAAAVAWGEVEAEAVAAGVRVEKIFHYEEGSEVVDELAENGVTLGEVWPRLYATESFRRGLNLYYFDEAGNAIHTYFNGNEFFPCDTGDYFMEASGIIFEPEPEADPYDRIYRTRDGTALWHDAGDHENSLGLIYISPVGDQVIYVHTAAPGWESNVVFHDKEGQVLAVNPVKHRGRFFDFTYDAKFLLVAEGYFNSGTTDHGTAVFDRNGDLISMLEPDLMVTTGSGWAENILGGGRGFLFQVGFRTELKEYPGDFVKMEPLYEGGRYLQVYNTRGEKLWERPIPNKLVGITDHGELLAYISARETVSLDIVEPITGDLRVSMPLSFVPFYYPFITISDDGERACLSDNEKYPKAGLFSARGEIVRFNADKLGSFHLTPDGKYVVFCGARTLAVFAISAAE